MNNKTRNSIEKARLALEQFGSGIALIGLFAKQAGEIFGKNFPKIQISVQKKKNFK